MKTMMNMIKRKKYLFVLAGLLLFVACQESLEERCARECKEYTKKKCPVLVANNVYLDSVSFDATKLLTTYYYTVEGVLDDAEALESHDVRGMLLKELKNSASTKLYKDAGYNFRYVYFSRKQKGTQLIEATFRESDYR